MTISLNTVAKYTRQNTGKHFLDSGDVYGRQYDKALPKQLLSMSEYGASISLTHWLAEYATIHPLHKSLYKWARKGENKESPWFEVGPDYMEQAGYKQVARDNIYNNDNDFDQVFIWEVYVLEHSDNVDWIYADDAVILIYCHTGCDVRGGYSSPLVVTFEDCEYSLPLDWQCDLCSEDLSDSDNKCLSVGYSGYPLGELETMGYELQAATDDNEECCTAINSDTGEVIKVFAEYCV